MKTYNLDTIQKVPLREVWPHEAHDFTKWLAEEQNLATLGMAVGIELELIETESSVGSFNVDIYAQESGTGRNVIIEKKFGAPHITKDGVTVAKEVELACPFENMGAQLVKEVASKTNDNAGDGTTTATVLAQAIIGVGLKNVTAGANPMDLKRGIDKAVAKVV